MTTRLALALAYGSVLLLACANKEGSTPGAADVPGTTMTDAGATPADNGAVSISDDEKPDASTAPTPSMTPTDPCALAASRYESQVKAKLNLCYQQVRKDVPFLAGRLKVTMQVDAAGKGTAIRAEPSPLGDKVNQCAVAAVKAAPFQDIACKGKTLTVVRIYGKDE